MTANPQTLWRNPKPVDAPFTELVDPSPETLAPLRGRRQPRVVERCLSRKALLQLVGSHLGERITCLEGLVWITQSGNPDDILLCAHESLTITRKGTILIQGLANTHLKISRYDVSNRS